MANKDLIRTLSLSIIKAQSALKQLVQREMKTYKINLTFEMLEIMVCLWKREGVNQQYLADQSSKDKASLTFLIHNMEKRGLVTRSQDANDKRNKLVYLTQHGKDVQDTIVPLVNALDIMLTPKFNEEEVSDSIKCLLKLSEAFKDI